MNRPTVIGIGELLWDCFPDARHPGGAPASVAFHTNQLGGHGVPLSAVGDDAIGKELVDHLSRTGLDTQYIQLDPIHPTGTVTVDTATVDDPIYTIHEGAAWDFFSANSEWIELAKNANAVCFGTLAQRSPASRTAIRACIQAASEATIVYDVNFRQPWVDEEWVQWSLQHASVVKLNASEICEVAELLGMGNLDTSRFATKLFKDYPVELICITRAAEGCCLLTREEKADVSGKPVIVADAVGAGDAFTAALIHGLLQQWPLTNMAHFANDVGGLVASCPGAMPDLADQLQSLKSAYEKQL